MRYKFTGTETRTYTIDTKSVTLSPGTEHDFTDEQLTQIPFNERGHFVPLPSIQEPTTSKTKSK